MYKRILIVVDPRPVARAAVTEGVLAAQAHGAELVFFTVMPRYSVPVTDAPPFVLESPQDFQLAAKANADRLLAAAAVAADRAGLKSRCEIGSGEDDARCIVEAARKYRCDLIVVASEGRNALMRMLLGSVIPGLITSSPVPVLVCKLRLRAAVGAKADVVPLKARHRAAAMRADHDEVAGLLGGLAQHRGAGLFLDAQRGAAIDAGRIGQADRMLEQGAGAVMAQLTIGRQRMRHVRCRRGFDMLDRNCHQKADMAAHARRHRNRQGRGMSAQLGLFQHRQQAAALGVGRVGAGRGGLRFVHGRLQASGRSAAPCAGALSVN